MVDLSTTIQLPEKYWRNIRVGDHIAYLKKERKKDDNPTTGYVTFNMGFKENDKKIFLRSKPYQTKDTFTWEIKYKNIDILYLFLSPEMLVMNNKIEEAMKKINQQLKKLDSKIKNI